MKLNDYQKEAARTARDGDDRLVIAALGLAGEAGEFIELIKKAVGHGHDLDLTRARKELGDVLWYVAELASALGLRLEDVAEANLDKLRARYPDGFSERASRERES